MVSDAEKFRGGSFEHFKTSVGLSRNGAVGYSIASSHMTVRL